MHRLFFTILDDNTPVKAAKKPILPTADSFADYRDLIKGIPKEYIVDAGDDIDGLEFFTVRGVKSFGKYDWIRSCWILFENKHLHIIDNQWKLEDLSYDTETGHLLMGFIFAPRKDDDEPRSCLRDV
jgi:hypothetical protein